MSVQTLIVAKGQILTETQGFIHSPPKLVQLLQSKHSQLDKDQWYYYHKY